VAAKPTYEELAQRVKDLEAEHLAEKKAAQELRLEAEQFQEFAKLLPIILFTVDTTSTITFVNRESLEFIGYSQEDLANGLEAVDLLIPADRDRARQRLADLLRGEEVGVSEYTALRKDGSTFPVLLRSSPIFIEGKVVGLRGFLFDTTDQKRTEEALRESEERYRQLFLTESDALILFYTDTGEIIDVNDTVLDMYGYGKEELLKLKVTDISAEPERTWKAVQEQADTGRTRGTIPLRYHRRKDGSSFPVEISTSLFLLRGRQVLCGAVRDISDRMRIEEELRKHRETLQGLVAERTAELEDANRKLRQEIRFRARAEQSLREGEERFRTVFEGSLDAIILADPETGEILDANPTTCEVVSKPYEEIVGLPYTKFVAPGSEDYVEELFRRVALDMTLGHPSEIPIQRADGSRILFEGLGQIIQIDGEAVALIVLRDITERKEIEDALRKSEARYRRLFEDCPIALWEVDASPMKAYVDDLRDAGIEDLTAYFADHPQEVLSTFMKGRVIDTNKANVELFGADSKEAFLNGIPRIATEESYRRLSGKELATLIEGKTESTVGEVAVQTFKGKRKRVFYRWSVAPGHERTFDKVLISIMDITERKQMEQEIQKTQKLESLGVLAGGIAHDFNNILTAISTNLSTARMYGDLRDDISEMLADAEKASVRAKNLTQQLLAFAKGGTPVKKPVSISRLITTTAAFSLSGSNVRCEFSLPDDLWLAAVDEGQIGQVVQNLIINADQAMPRGGTIKIRAENMVIPEKGSLPLENGLYLRISVTDQGVGVTGKDMPHIFDPFFTTKQKGSGLGLTTAFSILNNHAGHIEVESMVEEGTTFTVYLPALGKTSEETGRERKRLIKGEGKILLVDDEEIIWRAAGEALTRMGYVVQFAKDGAEGIRLYQEEMDGNRPFHAVIMDLTIPGGMGGKEAVGEILQIDPDAKIIASSGYSNDPVMSNFREYGFCGIITKPYRIEELGELMLRITQRDEE
jgi:PAS domain S-box-containing protein